jgi:hypothetical protein
LIRVEPSFQFFDFCKDCIPLLPDFFSNACAHLFDGPANLEST